MEESGDNRSFYSGVIVGTLLGGCVAALMSIRNRSTEAEYAIGRGLVLTSHTKDIVQRGQHMANEAIIRVQANSEVSQSI